VSTTSASLAALLLALLVAGALAWPAPVLLVRIPGLRRVPRAAMVLWQSVALSSVLTSLGALACLAVAAREEPASPARWLVAALAALLLVALLARIALSGHRTGTRLRSLRRRHRVLLDLLSSDLDDAEAGVRVLDHATPTAYCLPGAYGGRVVVSAGTRRLLSGPELSAVLAHERAHLRARHDLVLEAFTVLHQAFPRLASGRAALDEVALLVEVLADRAARRQAGATPLVRALVALADMEAPDAALGAGGAAGLMARVELVRDQRRHPGLVAAVTAAAVAVLALPAALLALPWAG
jgi:Zn-dependent protease with chaperone function